MGDHNFVYIEKNEKIGKKVVWKTEQVEMRPIVVDKEAHSGKS